MNCGVYQIKNTLNGKAYIGSSKNIKRRLGIHRSMLRHGTHRNPHLQNAWNKYGESAFVMEIIESTIPDNRIKREQFWIDTTPNRYNISLIAGVGGSGIKYGKRVMLVVQPTLYDQFAEACETNYKKISDVLRELMLEYAKKQESKND